MKLRVKLVSGEILRMEGNRIFADSDTYSIKKMDEDCPIWSSPRNQVIYVAADGDVTSELPGK